jgi:hypothetical protein
VAVTLVAAPLAVGVVLAFVPLLVRGLIVPPVKIFAVRSWKSQSKGKSTSKQKTKKPTQCVLNAVTHSDLLSKGTPTTHYGNFTQLSFKGRCEEGCINSGYLVMNGFSQRKYRPFHTNLFVKVLTLGPFHFQSGADFGVYFVVSLLFRFTVFVRHFSNSVMVGVEEKFCAE